MTKPPYVVKNLRFNALTTGSATFTFDWMLATSFDDIKFSAGKDGYFDQQIGGKTGRQTTRMYLKTNAYLSSCRRPIQEVRLE